MCLRTRRGCSPTADRSAQPSEHDGGSAPGCGGTQDPTGNIWFYRSAEPPAPAPLLGRYHIPRQQVGPPQECTLHNFNVVPINDNKAYIGVSSAYRGGTTVFDFTPAKGAAARPQNAGPVAPLIGREVGWYDAKVGGEADTWCDLLVQRLHLRQ